MCVCVCVCVYIYTHTRTLTKALGYACKGNCMYLTNSKSHGAVVVPSDDCWYMK